jgi:hypothetical protein
MVKIKKYDSGTPEKFLKWRLTLNEQVKNNGYDANYDNVMNLAQAIFAGRSLEAFLNEKRSQEAKNRVRKAKTQTGHTPSQIYDFAIFELAIRAFDIQSVNNTNKQNRTTTGLHSSRPTITTTATSARIAITIVIRTRTNDPEMIALDQTRVINPTPNRAVRAAGVAITTETVHTSTMTKRSAKHTR